MRLFAHILLRGSNQEQGQPDPILAKRERQMNSSSPESVSLDDGFQFVYGPGNRSGQLRQQLAAETQDSQPAEAFRKLVTSSRRSF
jgi:hypothetical protein